MIVRNQLFLKYPWLVPIYSVIGAAVGIWSAGAILNWPVLIIAGSVVVIVNAWFFYSLKQTRASQNRK
jgi:hypothetical protein